MLSISTLFKEIDKSWSCGIDEKSFLNEIIWFILELWLWSFQSKGISYDILFNVSSNMKLEISLLWDLTNIGNSSAEAVLISNICFSGICKKVSNSKSWVVKVFGFVAPTIETWTEYCPLSLKIGPWIVGIESPLA